MRFSCFLSLRKGTRCLWRSSTAFRSDVVENLLERPVAKPRVYRRNRGLRSTFVLRTYLPNSRVRSDQSVYPLIAFNSSRKSFFRFAGVRGAPSRSAQRQARHPSQSWKADTFVCARTPANASIRTPAHQRILKLQTAFDLRQNLTKSSCDRKQNSIISVEIFSFYATNGRLQKKRVCASTGRFAEDAFLRVIESLTIKNQG
jgi:hypothetical protein